MIPVKSRRLVGRECKAVLEGSSGIARINQCSGYVIAAAGRSYISAVIMDIHGCASRGYSARRGSELDGTVSTIRRIVSFSNRLVRVERQIVGDGYVQCIARIYMQSGFFYAGVGHEAMQQSADRVGCLLIRESYVQDPIGSRGGGGVVDPPPRR